MNKNNTDTILQMEALECGAACLAIILAYYKYYISLEEARSMCGVSRDGSKAVNILKAARDCGLEAYAAKSELEDIVDIDRPVIIFWEFNHFIVLEQVKNNKYYVNDPAVGRYVLHREEFDKGFTGLLLYLKPGENFAKKGKPFSYVKNLFHYFSADKVTLTYIVLCSLCLSIPGLIVPGLSKIFIDYILIKEFDDWLRPLLIGIMAAAFLTMLLTYLQEKYLLRAHVNMFVKSTTKFFWHIIHLPMAFFEQRHIGDISERIFANSRIATNLSGEVSSNLVSMTTVIFFFLFLMLISWKLTMISLAISLINILLLYYYGRKIHDKSKGYLQTFAKLASIETSAIQNIETIKSNSLEKTTFAHWADIHAQIITVQREISIYNLIMSIAPMGLTMLLSIIILSFGVLLVIQGELTIGSLVAFQVILVNFNQPLMGLLQFGVRLQEIKADLSRIQDVNNYAEDIVYDEVQSKSQEFHDGDSELAIEVNDLMYGYSRFEEPVVNNITCHIKKNQHIAIIGKSGCGKSSLAKLIAGLYHRWQGDIHIFGKDINYYTAENLSSLICYIDQDIYLFSGTIRDNLSLWNDEITDKNMLDALKIVELEEYILKRGGLDSLVEEGGQNFSGGQKQQLELARALCRNPEILILDEINANLDSDVEEIIFKKLKKLPITLIMISHRIKNITYCDNIIILDKGHNVATGKHHQLVQTCHEYQLLYAKEIQAEESE